MKNTLILPLGLLLFAGSLLTSCSSDDGASDNSSVGSAWTLTVKATKGGNEATTRVLTESTNSGKSTITAKWKTEEEVHVYSKDATDNYLGVLHPDADAATANLMGGLRSDFADTYYSGLKNCELDLQFPQAGSIYYTEQKGTLENISSKYDWATATVEIEGIDLDTRTIKPSSYVPVKFENQQAIVKFTLKDNAGDPLTPSSLTISATGLIKSIDNLGDVLGDVTISPDGSTNVIWAALRGISGTKVTLTATTVDKVTYTYTTKEPKTFENGKYYDITVKMTQQQ